jgi:hypothetical protein
MERPYRLGVSLRFSKAGKILYWKNAEMEPFEESGLFWLPNPEPAPRPGRLIFQHGHGGIQLRLSNAFEDLATYMAMVQDHPGYPVIFGQLDSGQSVTLTGGQALGTNMNLGGSMAVKVDIRCAYIFRGAHLEDGEKTKFDGFRVRFDHLDEWSFLNPPVRPTFDENGKINLESVEGVEVTCESFGGLLNFASRTTQEFGMFRASFERSSVIDYDASSPMTVPELTSAVSVPLQYFLTFSCGVPVHPISFAVRIEGFGQQLTNTLAPTWIDVGYSGWHPPAERDSPAVLRFSLRSIHDKLEALLNVWDSLYQEQERAIVRLFAITLGLDLYLDTRYLFAVQAAELYHRQRWPEGVLPKVEHKARVTSIADLVSERKLKSWLISKLTFSNEPSLAERLDRIVAHAGEETENFIRPDFTKVAKDTRNYLTHYDKRLEKKAAEGEDLWVLGSEVIALLEFCLMRDLGYDGPESFALSSQTPIFRALLQQLGAMSPIQITTISADPAASADEAGEPGTD